MEINITPSPDYEVRASEQALMEAFRQLLERGRKIRLASLASSSANSNTIPDDPGSVRDNE